MIGWHPDDEPIKYEPTPICDMAGGQLNAIRAALSRMEELTQTGIPMVKVELEGRAWVLSTGTPQSREVFLWALYRNQEESE